MAYKASHTIAVDGVTYNPGELIDIDDEETIEQLLLAHSIEEVADQDEEVELGDDEE